MGVSSVNLWGVDVVTRGGRAAGKPTIGIGQHRAVGIGADLGAAQIEISECQLRVVSSIMIFRSTR